MTFKEYYKIYLGLHTKLWNRRLHFIGQLATISYVCLCVRLAFQSLNFLPMFLAVPFVVYPFAWSGHFFIEKNKPAAFKNPLWAKVCDWVMFKDIIIGKIKW